MYPQDKLPEVDLSAPPPAGSAGSGCSSWGPRVSRSGCGTQPAVGVTDTTFRDAHQSLLATRVRTTGLLGGRRPTSRGLTPQLLSIECWGGATYDVALRFLQGGPVGAAGRAARGGAQHLPADAAARPQHRRLHAVSGDGDARRSSHEATATGIDIFRIFDALNNVD